MQKELVDLYKDLTNSESVSVHIEAGRIEIKIVSKWFEMQTNQERLEYLLEGLDVFNPNILRSYSIRFIALTPSELN